jgi:hypothetical protein
LFASLLLSLRAIILLSLLSVSLSSSVICLSVLVPVLLPATYHYMQYANHYGLAFVHKIWDFLGGKCSFSSSSFRRLLWLATLYWPVSARWKLYVVWDVRPTFISCIFTFLRHWMNYWEFVPCNMRPRVYKKPEMQPRSVSGYFLHPLRRYTSHLFPHRI